MTKDKIEDKIIYKDSDWCLVHEDFTPYGKVEYWLSHTCKSESPRTTFRGSYRTHRPCSHCGSVCPKNLQGLYNMMVYL